MEKIKHTNLNREQKKYFALVFFSIFIIYFLVFRKTGAYVRLGPLYAVELFMLTSFIFFSRYNIKKSDYALISAIAIYLFFNTLSLIAFGPPLELKDLCIGFYPLYVITGYLFSRNTKNPQKIETIIIIAFSLTPIIHLLISPVFLLFGEEIELPGNTFVYPLSIVFCLLAIRRSTSSSSRIFFLLLMITNSYLILILDQRAALLALVILVLLYFYLEKISIPRTGDLVLFLTSCTFVTVIGFTFNENLNTLLANTRFGSIDQIFNYFLSIFGSTDIGIGTREHRLEMWTDTINKLLKSPESFLFGLGFSTEISDTSFRNVHNGYISIMYRSGLFGLLSFLILCLVIAKRLYSKKSTVALIILICMLLDALTGTILDSPFLSVLTYFILGAFYFPSNEKFKKAI